MNDQATTIQDIKNLVHKIIAERDWQQFHNAKSLSMAIAAETAELMEHFLWLDNKESSTAMQGPKGVEIQHEIADIMWFLICLCNAYNIDLSAAMERKIAINVQRYSVEKSKGNRKKYTEL